ncbi:hypothetical protein CDAR_207201 [Caerostris darwini]|uniref:Uncharacterized protein n=1 Tax=Caerostris darwini TaxID=1538125 RepID=A0AAV4SM65_9ARAC|nr:hypothetical protein CDAR_207201 [Caerostris darwini]
MIFNPPPPSKPISSSFRREKEEKGGDSTSRRFYKPTCAKKGITCMLYFSVIWPGEKGIEKKKKNWEGTGEGRQAGRGVDKLMFGRGRLALPLSPARRRGLHLNDFNCLTQASLSQR